MFSSGLIGFFSGDLRFWTNSLRLFWYSIILIIWITSIFSTFWIFSTIFYDFLLYFQLDIVFYIFPITLKFKIILNRQKKSKYTEKNSRHHEAVPMVLWKKIRASSRIVYCKIDRWMTNLLKKRYVVSFQVK